LGNLKMLKFLNLVLSKFMHIKVYSAIYEIFCITTAICLTCICGLCTYIFNFFRCL